MVALDTDAHIEIVDSRMRASIRAIAKGNLKLDAVLYDVGWGEEFRLGAGLVSGQHLHGDFVGAQCDFVLQAYSTLGVLKPQMWKKSQICSDFLSHLLKQ